jgi:23S rRNA pseudouridine2605 synthase
MSERLQKVMAAAGVASRRACENMIEEGRVKINGQLAGLGMKVGDNDHITLDDKPISKRASRQIHKVIIYNKPEGEITTRSDPEGRPSVFAALPKVRSGRWISIGRLDINTGGLLLFTTDGELANRLMHPSYTVERKYAVRVLGEVTEAIIKKLMRGLKLEDGVARFLTIDDAGGTGVNHWYHVTLAEGRNREVRRLWEAAGLKVSRLMRISYAGIALPPYLRSGKYQELTVTELQSIYQLVGMQSPVQIQKAENRKRPPRKDTEGTKERTSARREAIQKSKTKTQPRDTRKKLKIKTTIKKKAEI